MKRSTVIMLVAFGGLMAVWALSGDKREVQRELPPLVIAGFLTEEISLQDIKIYNKDEASPYTRYTIVKKGPSGSETYVVELDPKTANEKKASDKIWWVTRTSHGGKKTMKVRAENYRLRMYNQVLARSFRSSYAFKATAKERKEYGLGAEHAITVTAVSPNQTVKLVIGNKHAMEGGDTATWVMNPDVEDVVYQISGHDLRTNFEAPWKDIRDRKILRINPGRIYKIEINNPRSPGRDTLVLERAKLTAEQVVEIAKAKKWDEVRKSDADWKITVPTGFTADGQEIGSWLESLERMSATDYVDLTDGHLPSKTGIDDAKQGVRVKLYDGDKVVEIVIGTKNPKGAEQDIYLQVTGHRTEIYTVAGWMGDQIVMDRDKLRDRRLLADLKGTELIGLSIQSSGELFKALKNGAAWTSTSSIDPKNVADFVKDLDGIRVEWQSAMSRADAGLTTPKTTIVLTWKDGVTRTLLVAAKQGDDSYAAFATGDLFKVPTWNAGRLHRRPRDFADKHILPVPPSAIQSLQIPISSSNRKTVTISRDGSGWKAANGTKIDPKAINALLQSFARSTFHEQVDGKPADLGLAPPAYAIAMKTTSGRLLGLQLSTKLLENNPYGALLVDGKRTRLFSISAMMAPMLQKTLADLKAGAGNSAGSPGRHAIPPGAMRPGAMPPTSANPAKPH